jgi:hypothetical protein
MRKRLLFAFVLLLSLSALSSADTTGRMDVR